MKSKIGSVISVYNWEEWEAICGQLLKMKYGDNSVSKIPDTQEGDGGLDYLVNNNIIFQCYAPKADYEPEKLFEKIKGKISKDLDKITSASAFHVELFKNDKVILWILLTPKITSKKVQSHCSTKTQDVRSLSLDYVNNDHFEVSAQEGDFYFDHEITEYIRRKAEELVIEIDLIEDDEIITFKNDNNQLVTNIDNKIQDQVPERNQIQLIDRYVSRYITYKKIMEQISLFDSNLHLKIDKFLKEKESQIEDMHLKGLLTNFRDFQAEKESLRQTMITNYSHRIDLNVLEKIIEGKEAAWLIECPLDF